LLKGNRTSPILVAWLDPSVPSRVELQEIESSLEGVCASVAVAEKMIVELLSNTSLLLGDVIEHEGGVLDGVTSISMDA